MSLVENLINQISTQGLGGVTKPQGFDMNDTTFANLLETQMNVSDSDTSSMVQGTFGAPAGLMIEPLNGIDFAESVQDQLEAIGETKLTNDTYKEAPFEMKEIDLGDYFSNLIKTSTDNNSDFMNFAKKQASNAYNVFSKGFVENMTDFVNDLTANL